MSGDPVYDARAKRERRLAIWNSMTPEQRDYDRFVAGQIPDGASRSPETQWGMTQGHESLAYLHSGCPGCTCHRSPPCSHCTAGHEEDGCPEADGPRIYTP